jgi:putative DNA primase/helicase
MKMAKNNSMMVEVTKFKQGKIEPERLRQALDAEREEKPHQSDAGNAELFSKQCRDIVRFNHTTKRWHIFDGIYWKPDNNQAIHHLAKEIAKSRLKNALTIQDTRQKESEMRFALRSEDHTKILSMLNSAKSLPIIRTTYEDWDNWDTLFQCDNALINLESVEPTEIMPEYMISQKSDVYYDPDVECPFFQKCLLEWMNGDMQMCQFIQRVMGYCLTGSTDEQCLFWLVGAGANGKSVLLDVFGMLYGDYRQDTGMDVFMKKYNRNNTNDLARLYNARVVTANESAEGRRVDEERIKLIAGGDNVTARFLHQEFFTYESKMKLIFATNALPKVKDFSEGFWRRVRIIRFDKYFASDVRIPKKEILDRLRSELSGILNYALEGLRHYHEMGLSPPKKVIQATQEYRNEEDDVARWFEDCVEPSEEERTLTKVAYQSFKEWFEDNDGGRPITHQLFSRRMGGMGYRAERMGGKRLFRGIKVLQDNRRF